MTEEMFRIVVTVGVGLACLSTIVLAGVAIALYRAIRGVQRKALPLMEHAQPVLERIGPMLDSVEVVIQKVGPAIEKVGPFIEKAGPVLEKIGPVVERIGPAIDKIVPAVEKAGPVVERIGPVVQQVGLFVDNANRMVAENRPRILQLSEQIVGIAKSGREQVEKIGGFLGDASQRAQTRLEEADRLASRLAIVDRGRVVTSGTPDELKGELRGDVVHVELPADTDANRAHDANIRASRRSCRNASISQPNAATKRSSTVRAAPRSTKRRRTKNCSFEG